MPSVEFMGKTFMVDEDGFIDSYDNWCNEWVQWVKNQEGIEELNEEKCVALQAALDAYLDYDCNYYDTKRLQLDIDFHLQIARTGGNKYLIDMIIDIYERMLVGFTPVFMTPLIPRFREEHVSIVQAIKESDLEKAQQLLREHLSITLDTLDAM